MVADINAVSIGADSCSARLWAEFFARASSRNVKAVKELLAAHLVAMATACQEIHRGRPHAAFQIGRRRKLIELCVCIAIKVHPSFTEGTSSSGDDLQLRQKLDEIVAELTELERSIFQGGEHVTTISGEASVSDEVHNDRDELKRMFQQKSRKEIVDLLMKIWYPAYLSKADLNQLFIEPKSPAPLTAAENQVDLKKNTKKALTKSPPK